MSGFVQLLCTLKVCSNHLAPGKSLDCLKSNLWSSDPSLNETKPILAYAQANLGSGHYAVRSHRRVLRWHALT